MAKIICVGLQKTGLSSLAQAIRMLGMNAHQHISPSIYRNFLMDHSDFGCDFPFFMKYEELYNTFPDAKFVITIRDDKSWLESMKYEVDRIKAAPIWKDEWVVRYRMDFYGTVDFEEDKLLEAKHRHYKQVYDFFADKGFLELDILNGEGWKPLCDYIGVDVPRSPFPHENKRKSINTL